MNESVLLRFGDAIPVLFKVPYGAQRCKIPNDPKAPKWARCRDFVRCAIDADLGLAIFRNIK